MGVYSQAYCVMGQLFCHGSYLITLHTVTVAAITVIAVANCCVITDVLPALETIATVLVTGTPPPDLVADIELAVIIVW